MSMLEAAAAEAVKQTAPVTAIHVKVGPLSGVVLDALSSAWECARIGSPLEHAALVVEETSIATYCLTCESVKPVVSPQWLRCSTCGAAATEIVSGRELELFALEVET